MGSLNDTHDGETSPPVYFTAHDFANRGVAVVPVSKYKKPLFKGWLDLATTDPAQIDMWAEEYPGCMWAAITGKDSGKVVVDVDVKHGNPGAESLERLITEAGELETMRVRTQNAGLHFWFEYPSDREQIKSLPQLDGFPGIEIRGERSAVVLPGSIGEAGAYECEEHYLMFAPLPPEILYRIPVDTQPKPKGQTTQGISREVGQRDPVKIHGKQCHDAARKAVIKAWSSEVFETADELLEHIRDWYAKNCQHEPDTDELKDLVTGWIEKNPIAGPGDKTSQADRLVSVVRLQTYGQPMKAASSARSTERDTKRVCGCDRRPSVTSLHTFSTRQKTRRSVLKGYTTVSRRFAGSQSSIRNQRGTARTPASRRTERIRSTYTSAFQTGKSSRSSQVAGQ